MEINFDNYRKIAKNLCKDKGLTKTNVEMLESIFFHALHNLNKNATVKIRDERQIRMLTKLAELGYIETYDIWWDNKNWVGAKITLDCELK